MKMKGALGEHRNCDDNHQAPHESTCDQRSTPAPSPKLCEVCKSKPSLAEVGKRPGRNPYLAAEIDLPLPPPSNVAALERRHWLDAAATAFNAAGIFALPGVIGVRVIAGIPVEPRDLNEITNTLIALLTDRGVIDDPGVIVDTLARWDRTIETGRVRLVVRQTKPPRERIGAETRRRASERNRRHAALGASA